MLKEAGKYRILFVDDEEANLRVFKQTFKWDYDIVCANSGLEAKELIFKFDIDLIITDQRMPGMSGTEFLEIIVPYFPEIPRIILTGYTDVDSIIDAVNKGKIYHYVTKPWKNEDLKIIIDKALDESNLKKHNRELINSLQSTNESLLKTLGELDNFIYRASHDLMSPITSILGLVNLAKSEQNISTVRLYNDKIGFTANKMKYLLSHLTIVNRINSDEIQLTLFDLHEMISAYESYSKGRVEVKLKSIGKVKVKSDYSLLNIAVNEVFENCVNFNQKIKQLEVLFEIEGKDDYVIIRITDNGVGVDKNYLDKVFDLFFRGDNSNSNGLGLYISKKIFERLGGNLRIDSNNNGGTTVTMYLPKDMESIDVKEDRINDVLDSYTSKGSSVTT